MVRVTEHYEKNNNKKLNDKIYNTSRYNNSLYRNVTIIYPFSYYGFSWTCLVEIIHIICLESVQFSAYGKTFLKTKPFKKQKISESNSRKIENES